jgi:hypothetical protein
MDRPGRPATSRCRQASLRKEGSFTMSCPNKVEVDQKGCFCVFVT